MILLINFYKDKNEIRQRELEYCIAQNINNPLIYKIVVLHESYIYLPDNEKIISIVFDKRPTYTEFFNIGNTFKDRIKILANTDIYFDSTLIHLKKIKKNQVFALCRWNLTDNKLVFYNLEYSQDVWVWKTNIEGITVNFGLGIAGCDNSIAYILNQKYKVLSPSLSIKSIHVHQSNIRNYINEKGEVKQVIPRPYLPLKYTQI